MGKIDPWNGPCAKGDEKSVDSDNNEQQQPTPAPTQPRVEPAPEQPTTAATL
eukprot:NODE_11757_length_274_cov_2.808219.p5 GENE.NODE_11757_length_274_cov_2.808219~~NODE_11757_length_274_cov_2.808219.p5  ORF type:complete len:52 (-),score=16.62 NODE_11757_length_274_cov_2.808219:101-256(-)